ncbi:MAG: AMP-binding protein [Rhodocyclaceae bacterium]|nr:AMP-binding protein [Rhodocyclaceae bacterium]
MSAFPHMGALIADRLERHADRPFLVVPARQRTYTYADLANLTGRARALLGDAGLARGDHAVMALRNSPEYLALLLASLQAGIRLLLVGADYSASELEGAIEGLPVGRIFIDADLPADGRLPADGSLAVVPVAAGLPGLQALSAPPPAGDGADWAYVMCSSGSTGRPKRIAISHRNMLAELEAMIEAYGLAEGDRHLCVLPLFHASGLYRNVLIPFCQGGSTVLCEAFDQGAFWPLVAEHGIHFVQVVPSILAVLADQEAGPDPRAGRSLKYIGSASAPLSPKLAERFEARFGIPVVQGFGLTELTCGCTLNETEPSRRRLASVGRPLRVNEVRVLDEAGRFLPVGQEGEVVVRGDNVMIGYLAADGQPLTPWADGWFHTHDLGYVDADGFVYLTGRKSDIINRGGHKISPVEVENVLMQHPGLRDVVVVGVPHAMLGEDAIACVVRNSGADCGTVELLHFAQERLPAFKVPTSFQFHDKLPRTGPGKINRKKFAAAVAEAMAAEAAAATEGGAAAMDDGEVAARVRAIFAEVFALPPESVTDDLAQADLRAWDSLGTIRLVLALEESLPFRYDPGTAGPVRSVGELVALVRRCLAAR